MITNTENKETSTWTPESWKRLTTSQQPQYDDEQQYNLVFQEIQQSPGIVELKSILQLRDRLKQVNNGERFIIQAGDCAEMFEECTDGHLQGKISFLEELSQILSIQAVLIGRFCGQFAKPRSQEYERERLMSYKGDLINGLSENQRVPDPQRLIQAQQLQRNGYKIINSRLYISHECLHLGYESSLVRCENQSYYASSSEFIWIGERTRRSTDGHINFVSGLQNPCGVKISSNISQDEFIKICQQLNPLNLQDKLVIITRMGSQKIAGSLENLVDWKKQFNLNFIWMCDPMHGNTITTPKGSKTRLLKDIKDEIRQFVQILRKHNEIPGGIHLEATANKVKECLEDEADPQVYESACDPRLNREQTIEVMKWLQEQLLN